MSVADTPDAPKAQPDQPKESEGPSLAKEGTQTAPSEPAQPETKPAPAADETAPAPVIASAGEQDKEPVHEATSTSQAKDAPTEGTVAAPAPAANSQAPISTPALSEVEALPTLTSDPTGPQLPTNPATSDEKNANDATLNAIVPTMYPDPDHDPEKGGLTEQQALVRRMRNEKIQTRLAKFFTWILLLAFVILPGTFTRINKENNGATDATATSQCGSSSTTSSSTTSSTTTPKPNPISAIASIPLFAVVYLCAFLNGGAICWLWYLRADDPEWLYTYLFSPGFLYSFSGLVTTFVNIYGVQDGKLGTASSTTLAVTITCTVLYGILTVVYHQRRVLAARRRRSKGRG